MKKIFTSIFLAISLLASAQTLSVLNQEKKQVSFRGLSVINDDVLWVSGNHGTIGKSTDAGKTFIWSDLSQYAERDFRDIYAFNEKTAIAIAVGSPGLVIKTTDGGKNWKEVYKDESENVFLDDIEFASFRPNIGIILGDAIDGKPYVLLTIDQGKTWEKANKETIDNQFPSLENASFFAASGSNIKLINTHEYVLITAGKNAQIISQKDGITSKIQFDNVNETTGFNGIDYSSKQKYGIAVGGDFDNPDNSDKNIMVFTLDKNGKIVPTSIQKAPNGYKSGIAILKKNKAVSCGITGTSVSLDQGINWEFVSSEVYNVCKTNKKGRVVYLAGTAGKIAKLEF